MNLKILISIFCLFLTFISCKKENKAPLSTTLVNTSETDYVSRWRDNRLGMMIHFGLYSHLGGVYKGQNISKGYSEQIMSHASIPPSEYKAFASEFNPTKWDPKAVVELAKKGGFKSVVITAKHHDGFCMWDSKTSDFTITKATPYKKDVIKDMANACNELGLDFGLYFSLIDWNATEGAIIPSPHNVDSISPALHALNLAQIKELCSNYGNISELWFDMGDLSMEQSVSIRKVVKELQPQCMVGGRLSNGQGDFEVMGDNQMPPEMKFDGAWQTVQSMYANTWGYRSWQSIGDANTIVQHQLKNIVNTTLRGGNYLLNIGPAGDGSILPLEQNVITKIGAWVNPNNEAIFNTRPFPGGEKAWGGIVYNNSKFYMLINSLPSEGELVVYGIKNEIQNATTLLPPFTELNGTLSGATMVFDLGLIPLDFNPATIMAVGYVGPLDLLPSKQIYPNEKKEYELNTINANTYYAMSGSNYYTTVPSPTKYSWHINNPKEVSYDIMLYYSQEEKEKKVKLRINGHDEIIDLSKYKTFYQEPYDNKTIPSDVYIQGPYINLDMNTHPGPLGWAVPGTPWGPGNKLWNAIDDFEQGKIINLPSTPNQSYYYLVNLLGTQIKKNHILAIGADDACMAWHNGRLIYSSGFPKKEPNAVFLDIPVEQESNTFIIKHLNKDNVFKTFFTVVIDQIRFEKAATYTKFIPRQTNYIELLPANPLFPNESINTPNIKIIIKEKTNK